MTARALIEDLVDDPKLLALVDAAFDYRDAAVDHRSVTAAGLAGYDDAADRLATLVTATAANTEQAGRTLLAVLELLAYLGEAHDQLATPTPLIARPERLPGEIPLPLEQQGHDQAAQQ